MASDLESAAITRAALYAKTRGLTIEKTLGAGWDGIVQATNRTTAIKSFRHPQLYRQERDVYLRFEEKGFVSANEFHVPRLIEYDDNLQIVEMTIVTPPYIVDFAGAQLDRKNEFPPDVMANWLEEKKEQFEANWPRVKRAMWKFAAIGVHLNDVAPRNVNCG
jgi:hypothetical protein